jgi:hypothetical protein
VDKALSRNRTTHVFKSNEIRYNMDSKSVGDCTTNRVGWMSPMAANEIKLSLGLPYHPSSLQGRIGNFKGLWRVYHEDPGTEIWIEWYDSQSEWEDRKDTSAEVDRLAHRTFQVLSYAHPLKSGNMSFQMIPILMSQSIDKRAMRNYLQYLNEECLKSELDDFVETLTDPSCLQEWICASNQKIDEKLRVEGVPYRAGLPISEEDQVQMMLDGGFEPKTNAFLFQLTTTLLAKRCNRLQDKLGIRIPKSIDVFITPDPFGVLGAGEVYIELSKFVDEKSNISGLHLAGQELLIASSPAHFASDAKKVQAVWRVEFVGITDVLICSTMGNPSIAGSLFGGDCDGKIVFLTWEPKLVKGFVNARVPEKPDLIEEGFVRKDKTTYGDLTKDHHNPTLHWLQHCFKLNMRPNLQEQCTLKKDLLCFHSGTITGPNEVAWHTLLGELSDQAKHGTLFDEEDLAKFEAKYGKGLSSADLVRNGMDIITRFEYQAIQLLQNCKKEYRAKEKTVSRWDEDLVEYYRVARKWAENSTDWKILLDDLDESLRSFKLSWKESLIPTREELFDSYLAIQPSQDHPLALALNPPCLNPGVTQWALLRASALFSSYHEKKEKIPNFPWWIAGRQLAQLKASSKSSESLPHTVVPSLYAAKNSNAASIKRLQSQNQSVVLPDDFVVEHNYEFEAEEGESG